MCPRCIHIHPKDEKFLSHEQATNLATSFSNFSGELKARSKNWLLFGQRTTTAFFLVTTEIKFSKVIKSVLTRKTLLMKASGCERGKCSKACIIRPLLLWFSFIYYYYYYYYYIIQKLEKHNNFFPYLFMIPFDFEWNEMCFIMYEKFLFKITARLFIFSKKKFKLPQSRHLSVHSLRPVKDQHFYFIKMKSKDLC